MEQRYSYTNNPRIDAAAATEKVGVDAISVLAFEVLRLQGPFHFSCPLEIAEGKLGHGM